MLQRLTRVHYVKHYASGQGGYESVPVDIALRAIEYAKREAKQQLMAKAVDVTIAIPYQNGYGGYTQLVDSKQGLPFGENLKVFVIKE